MNAPRKGQQHRPSTWSRARRDLASPQGSSLMIALMLTFLITVIGLILENYASVPKSIIFPIVVIAYIVIIGIVLFKISAMNKKADEARREAYRQKFEQNLDALRAQSGQKDSGSTRRKKS